MTNSAVFDCKYPIERIQTRDAGALPTV
jgi:hypothetical protein